MRSADNQNIFSYATPGNVRTSINWIAVRRNGDFTLIPDHELNNAYFGLFQRKLTPVFNRVLTNLKRQKEYLALQLNLEYGNISENDYAEQEEKYLVETENITAKELKQDIDILFSFSGNAMDAEEVSEAFNCHIDTAEEALQALLSRDMSSAGV
jgi:hypothetical protein